MCGIAGQLNVRQGGRDLVADTRSALAMLRHRGPDQFGIYADAHAALGSARLSIVDLGGGQQPIANEDERYWIVFNGEIFNHIELRVELEARGHRFATHSDTEVILHLYEDLGPQCLNKLNGQFAIAIWDRQKKSLFLGRDRLGVRPLFYISVAGRLLFASEIKALLTDPEVPRELDPVALDQIFTAWSPISPRTAFRDICEVPPGHYLLADDQKIEVQQYWKVAFPEAGASERRSFAECVEEFQRLLMDAVRIRLRADVPVSAYLSGGLDSSTITSVVRNFSSAKLETFSIAFTDENFDESAFQKQMAEFLGTNHHVVQATHSDIGRVFPEVIWHTEVPILRTSPAPMFLLSKLVRDHGFKVALTGEGADEFLAGYDIFKESQIRRFWARQPDSKWRQALLQKLYPEIPGLAQSKGSSFLAAFFGAGLTETASPDYSHSLRWRNTRRASRFFSPDLVDRIKTAGSDSMSELRYPEEFKRWGPLEQAQYLEIEVFLSQYLLCSQGDRMGMAHSVEGRFPFLDYRVVEFCNSLPSRYKLCGLREKYLLRRAAEKWLPPEIARRRKRPYRAPIHKSFFHRASPDYVRELLSPQKISEAGLFNPAPVAQLTAKAQQGKTLGETEDMAVAGIISAQLFWSLFLNGFKSRSRLSDVDDVKVCLR
jgi:asparagine synthase (glutamine-hydrolysing)